MRSRERATGFYLTFTDLPSRNSHETQYCSKKSKLFVFLSIWNNRIIQFLRNQRPQHVVFSDLVAVPSAFQDFYQLQPKSRRERMLRHCNDTSRPALLILRSLRSRRDELAQLFVRNRNVWMRGVGKDDMSHDSTNDTLHRMR